MRNLGRTPRTYLEMSMASGSVRGLICSALLPQACAQRLWSDCGPRLWPLVLPPTQRGLEKS